MLVKCCLWSWFSFPSNSWAFRATPPTISMCIWCCINELLDADTRTYQKHDGANYAAAAAATNDEYERRQFDYKSCSSWQAPSRIKSPVILLSVSQCIQTFKHQRSHYPPIVRGIYSYQSFPLLAVSEGNPPVTSGYPHKWPVNM